MVYSWGWRLWWDSPAAACWRTAFCSSNVLSCFLRLPAGTPWHWQMTTLNSHFLYQCKKKVKNKIFTLKQAMLWSFAMTKPHIQHWNTVSSLEFSAHWRHSRYSSFCVAAVYSLLCVVCGINHLLFSDRQNIMSVSARWYRLVVTLK